MTTLCQTALSLAKRGHIDTRRLYLFCLFSREYVQVMSMWCESYRPLYDGWQVAYRSNKSIIELRDYSERDCRNYREPAGALLWLAIYKYSY